MVLPVWARFSPAGFLTISGRLLTSRILIRPSIQTFQQPAAYQLERSFSTSRALYQLKQICYHLDFCYQREKPSYQLGVVRAGAAYRLEFLPAGLAYQLK